MNCSCLSISEFNWTGNGGNDALFIEIFYEYEERNEKSTFPFIKASI